MDKSNLDPNTTPSLRALKAQVALKRGEIATSISKEIKSTITHIEPTNVLINHIADLHAKLILLDVVGGGLSLFEEEE